MEYSYNKAVLISLSANSKIWCVSHFFACLLIFDWISGMNFTLLSIRYSVVLYSFLSFVFLQVKFLENSLILLGLAYKIY